MIQRDGWCVPGAVCGKVKKKETKGETMENKKPILDACCGSRMFWYNKHNPNVVFCDNRVVEKHEYYKNRYIEIKPDVVCDFTKLPFADNSFKLVVFDPPHLQWAGETSWIRLKYGNLPEDWKPLIRAGFWECMRVLEPYGILIFKWSEVQIPAREVIQAIGSEPLFGHRSGKHNNTHWMCFMKLPEEEAE